MLLYCYFNCFVTDKLYRTPIYISGAQLDAYINVVWYSSKTIQGNSVINGSSLNSTESYCQYHSPQICSHSFLVCWHAACLLSTVSCFTYFWLIFGMTLNSLSNKLVCCTPGKNIISVLSVGNKAV